MTDEAPARGARLLLGVEIPGIYDGVAVYVYSDGRLENAFGDEAWNRTNRQRRIDDWIKEHGAALRREHGLEDPDE